MMVMTREQLEKHLANGQVWGFIKETGSADYLGWILVSKSKVMLVPHFEPSENPTAYRKWQERNERVRANPYTLSVKELRRDVHERGDYEDNADYRMRKSWHFATLEEVEEALQTYGKTLADILPASEIDLP